MILINGFYILICCVFSFKLLYNRVAFCLSFMLGFCWCTYAHFKTTFVNKNDDDILKSQLCRTNLLFYNNYIDVFRIPQFKLKHTLKVKLTGVF